MEIYIDLLNGDDTTSLIYKTLDVAYSNYRDKYDAKLNFNIMNGHQYLGLNEYKNCEFKESGEHKSTNYIKINKELTLIDVTFSIDLKIELNDKSTESLISTKGKVELDKNYNLDVVELKKTGWFQGNGERHYSDLTLIHNDGTLDILGNINVKVSRKFTLVNNNLSIKSTIPNLECQGGILFYSSDDARSTEIMGYFDKKIIKINPVNNGSYFYSKVYNDFQIVNCYNNSFIIKKDYKYL